MKAVKEIVRKYYKYVRWTQPTLSANGTVGGSSFACNQSSTYSDCYAYKAFDNDNSSMWHSADNASLPHWLEWYNPKPLKISMITLIVGNSSSYPDMPNVFEIQNSSDGVNWVTVYSATNSATAAPATLTIDLSTVENNVAKYWRYVVKSVKGRNYGNCRNINIVATYAEESTQQDYDFYKDVPIYKLIYSGKKQVPYSIEYNNNVIPAMTSNTEPYNTVTIISGSLYYSNTQWRGFGNPSAGTIEPSSNSAAIRYSFETPIPQGDYNLIFWYSNDTPKYGTATYRNRKLYSYSVTLNYSDNTTEIVSSWNGTLTNTYKFVDYFKAGKEIKSIDFAFTGDASGENLVLGCIYDIQLYEGEIIYKEFDTYKAPQSREKGQVLHT